MYDVSSAGVKAFTVPRKVTMRANPTETITSYIVGTTQYAGQGSISLGGVEERINITGIINADGVSIQGYSADGEL